MVTCCCDFLAKLAALLEDTNRRVYILAISRGTHSDTGKSHILVTPKGGNVGCTWHCTSQFWHFTLTITLCPRNIRPEQWSTLLAWWLSNLGPGDNLTVRFGVRRLCGSIWWKEQVSYMSPRKRRGRGWSPLHESLSPPTPKMASHPTAIFYLMEEEASK